jgi:hypothetical protein
MVVGFRSQAIPQTDYRAKYPNKQDSGCFVATIRHAVESRFKRAFTMNQWTMLWKRAIAEGAISGEGFVNNHEHVGNIALDIIGQWDEGYRFHYVQIEEPYGSVLKDFKPRFAARVYQKGLVWRTETGVHMNYGERLEAGVLWDPYPGLELKELVSIRHYYIGGVE